MHARDCWHVFGKSSCLPLSITRMCRDLRAYAVAHLVRATTSWGQIADDLSYFATTPTSMQLTNTKQTIAMSLVIGKTLKRQAAAQ